MRRHGSAAYAVVIGMLVVGAVMASWLLTRGATDALSGLDPEPVPVLAPVEAATVDYSAEGTLTATLTDGAELPATGLSGMVTAVGVVEGEPLHEGDVVYAVGGVPVVAYSGGTVLHRSLQAGSRGPDVAVAQRLLSALLPDVDVETDGVFGPGTVAAVRAYERTWGAAPTGALQPDWFVYLPSDPFDVAAVAVRIGTPAPSPGEPVVTGAVSLSQIELMSASVGPPGGYEFLVQGRSIAVTRDEAGDWTVTDPAQAAQVVLTQVGETSTVSLTGRTRLVDGEPGQAVPGAAVITDAAGATCVALATADEAITGELTPVTVLGSSTTGLAQLEATLDEGARVLVNPVPMLGDVTCPSS